VLRALVLAARSHMGERLAWDGTGTVELPPAPAPHPAGERISDSSVVRISRRGEAAMVIITQGKPDIRGADVRVDLAVLTHDVATIELARLEHEVERKRARVAELAEVARAAKLDLLDTWDAAEALSVA
jgi:hypothetical protein